MDRSSKRWLQRLKKKFPAVRAECYGDNYIKLVDDAGIVWSGVTVAAAQHFRGEYWEVEINWPACGAVSIEGTKAFISLVQAAVFAAEQLAIDKGIPETE